MGCDTKLNESIRKKLKERCDEFGMLGQANINAMPWTGWGTFILSRKGKALDLLKEWIHSCEFTPAELRYIKENIEEEYWAKLGLKVEEEIMPVHIPQLSAEKQEALRVVVERVERGKSCDMPSNGPDDKWLCADCRALFGRTGLDTPQPCAGRTGYKQMLPAFRKVLAAQKPILEYEIPQLDEKEREALEAIIRHIEAGSVSCGSLCGPHGQSVCKKIFVGFPQFGHCCFCDAGPDKEQALAALKDVLSQQKPLKKEPPKYNTPILSDKAVENWKWWLKCERGDERCPWTRAQNVKGTKCNEQCQPIFPDTPSVDEDGAFTAVYCPCSRNGRNFVRALVEDVLAKQPAKEFKQYAAVRIKGRLDGDSTIGMVVKIVRKMSDNTSRDEKRKWHHNDFILPITNPSEALKILMELEGKPDIVKAIKGWLNEKETYWKSHHHEASAYSYRAVYSLVLSFIDTLEAKAGKENSHEKLPEM